jgi:hypothetical protein
LAGDRRRLISRRAWTIAGSLIVAHFVVWAYVVWRHVLYDEGGFEGLMWWLVAFWVLPAVGLVWLAGSAMASLIGRKSRFGE